MGVARYNIYFSNLPSRQTIESKLLELTGLPLVFTSYGANTLHVEHPNRPNSAIDLTWFNEEPKHFWISAYTPSRNYIEVSLLVILKQFGGKAKDEILDTLPEWAGKQWTEIWPSSLLARIKKRWNGSLPTNL